MEEKHTENDAAINIFMAGLLCKAEGKYYSSRINIFDKKPPSLSILLGLEKVCYDCVKMLLKDNIWQIRFAFLGVKKVTMLSTLKAFLGVSV